MTATQAHGWFLTSPGEPLVAKEFTLPPPAADEAIVKVAGCGLCHTDLTFMSGAVKTKAPLPLVLGHEISGIVTQAGAAHAALVGRQVIVPAVLPCGDCDLCRAGRDNICQRQTMPGNDFHGGFASHLKVPARFLCALPADLGAYRLPDLSVIADAVTTPYQSLRRSGLAAGELAVVIGAGGIGIYMVQHARAAGATVVAIDVDHAKLERAKALGAAHVIAAGGRGEDEVKKELRALVKQAGLPATRWRVFETSGTAAGQSLGFSLLSYAGTLGIVGFTMDKVQVRLSNIMAFDADVFGNWGCRPAYYRPVVDDVIAGRINVVDNVEQYPLDSINDVIGLARQHKLTRRAVLVP